MYGMYVCFYVWDMIPQVSVADDQSSPPPPDELAVGAALGVVGLLLVPDAQASASEPQSSLADDVAAPLRGVVVAGGAAGVSLGIPQSSNGAFHDSVAAPLYEPDIMIN
jgi:hypothetical protein